MFSALNCILTSLFVNVTALIYHHPHHNHHQRHHRHRDHSIIQQELLYKDPVHFSVWTSISKQWRVPAEQKSVLGLGVCESGGAGSYLR